MSGRPEAIEEILHTETPHVIGALTRRFGRFEAAEDAAQEALLAATRQWPQEGVPAEPRSWLIRVGYRRMVDAIRSEQAERRREEEYTLADPARVGATSIGVDDSLNLLLLCCHPALSSVSQVALTLRAVGGLTTSEIAGAYGVTEQTMGVRISRAKQQLRKIGARFEFSVNDDAAERLSSTMKVLYLVFNEGYTASSGRSLVRTDLSAEAIRLARMLHGQTPDDPETTGLLALMLLTDARRAARTDEDGTLVPLADQDRSRWDRRMIAEGIELIESAWTGGAVGVYRIQAAIAAVHVDAPTAAATDWEQIAALYLALEQMEPGGPVMLSRVVAVAHAFGDETALELLTKLDHEHGLLQHPLTRHRALAIRAHLLERSGRADEARADYRLAAELTANEIETRYLHGRADGVPG
ncbi:sigma-70 family RNA polymerase sigma factor [Microbacterium sp. M28]|uniref:RNA polymerase sigma factor n=1 Tax=Microbacterium sp. M28 TaxID=2962064 RepID=UPI0021F44986|nr:sigma-70 family RNA polymerase sigma factor [Microbacterium sp. M28]UYO95647.1 sigma-70 family RNA polymerase sigma factor [Microbacterium sp. M28]